MSARRVNMLISFVVLLSLLVQPFAIEAQVDKGTGRQGDAAPAAPPSSGLYRTTVTVDGPARRARLEKLGVVVLADEGRTTKDEGGSSSVVRPSSFLVLADADQLAALARLGFRPTATDDADALVAAHAADKPWLATAWAEARAAASLVSLSTSSLSTLTSLDDDGDGLTNTEEAWWCTDPLNPDSDGDGRGDGAEIRALRDWLGNKRAGPPGETPWPSWPFNATTCPDKDHDSIPNLAERWDLGLDMDLESSDRDKFDDGQELFGVTYCPGGDLSCGYGDLPRGADSGYVGAAMPAWVKAPGNHPLVAAFPVPEIDVVPSSLHVETVTTVTTDHTISQGTERSYSTAKTEGTSTSVADTVTWNEWQEESIATTVPLSRSALEPQFLHPDGPFRIAGAKWDILKFSAAAGLALCVVATAGGCAIPAAIAGAGVALGDIIVNYKESQQRQTEMEKLQNEIKQLKQEQATCRNNSCKTNTGSPANPLSIEYQRPSVGTQDRNAGDRKQAGVTASSQAFVQQFYQWSYPQYPLQTTTNTRGRSWGGAHTTTNTKYEEHTITNGEAFSSGESWGTATAVDSSHAADLWFTYQVRNTGTEYAREIANLAFNVYIGDDPNPAITYFVGPDLGGDSKFHNFMPNEEHTYTSRRIPLTLEQMKAVDLGGPVRIVVEDFTYGIDELFYEDAVNAGVLVAMEDGTDDGDEAIDTYLIPTWGSETVLDVLARYFPHTADAEGNLIAIWTPEYRADTPSWCIEPFRPGTGLNSTQMNADGTQTGTENLRVSAASASAFLWCKHALSTADWWNVYTNGLGDGSEGFQDTPATPGSVALFRFNKDTDLDGYSDRSEQRLGTDPDDPASFPRPELIAGVHSIRVGNQVTATLSLLNTGLYDAYGVEAVMIAPDDSVSITNNTVGGSGRVRAQKQVVVGSRILLQSPLPPQWTQSGHARPAVGGYYTGSADCTYTFTVQCANPGGCDVGAGTWNLAWNDGAGASGALNFGAGYASPTFLDVGSLGVKLALYSGKVYNGESFTVEARTPRDTFQYTINREPYTEPVVVVSYNDPQGNHRFITPVRLSMPTENLAAYGGQMLPDPGVEIVTTEAVEGFGARSREVSRSARSTKDAKETSADGATAAALAFASSRFASSSPSWLRDPASPASTHTLHLVVNNPTEVTLTDAHLFLEFINITGTVVSEVPVTVTVPPGPTVQPVTFDVSTFNPPYDPDQDYIVMAFWTDYQGNIVDTAARPLSSFQADPRPAFAMSDADATWDFGTAQQGALLKRRFNLASTGFADLKAMLVSSGGRWDRTVDSLVSTWIDTGITVQAGEAVGIRAGGTVCYGNNGTSLCYGPNGRGGSAAGNWLAPGLPELSLVAKIGDAAPFLVGPYVVVTADRNGRLYLGANDCSGCYADNGGHYQAHIEVYGLPVDGRSLTLAPGDTQGFDLLLNTQYLPEGPFERTLTIRTSDPDHSTRTLTVRGTITAYAPDTAPGALQRPLDWSATFASGTQGQWVEFTHTLGPDPQTLHPVKVYSQDYSKLWGVGKYATPFGQGTASYDMFGDGRDGVMPSSGNLDYNNGVGVGVVNSGSAGSYYINVTDVYAVWRINPGDVVLIHQTQGTNAGCWELNKAVSDFGGGTATYQLEKPLRCNYASGGNNHAQIQRVPQYTDCPVSGTVTPLSGWNGSWGGIFAVMCNKTMTLTGQINVRGLGYRGGYGNSVPPYQDCHSPAYMAWSGEGYIGPSTQYNTYAAHGNGGGPGHHDGKPCNITSGGAGGGNGTQGERGDGQGGAGGWPVGTSDLSFMLFGGGGGGGKSLQDRGPAVNGANGGGIIVIYSKQINIAGGSLNADGIGLPGISMGANGGGGAGGSILMKTSALTMQSGGISAVGGPHAPATGGYGQYAAAGGQGRIRIEYCESLTGSTNPPASTQKLNCYIAEQVESAPYTTTRLNLPESFSNGRTYQVQYGRRLVFGGAGEQTMTLRVPAGAFNAATLDALLSEVGSGSLTFRLDIGDDGSWDWEWSGDVNGAAALNSPGLHAAFSRYWASHGAPLPPSQGGTEGGLDVPVRVSLSKAGQVLLTNLQVTPTGSRVRSLRLPARPYDTVTAQFTVNNGDANPGPLTVAADVGDDGTVDWTWSGTPTYPATLTTGNLAAAVNAYLSGRTGEVDVPMRFYVAPFLPLGLGNFTATPTDRPDASIGDGDVTFGGAVAAAVHEYPTNTRIAHEASWIRGQFVDGADPTEGDTITVTATIHNPGSLATGPLTAAFYAAPAGGTPWYIGSAFVADVAPGSQSLVTIPWNTLGFTGTVPVRVVVDPYDRVAELSETNNVATATLTILTRPDLQVAQIALSDPAPVAGKPVTVTVTLRNAGQATAAGQTTTLYNGNPDAGGTAIGNRSVASIAGGASRTATFTWTPAKPGPYRLFARADRAGVVGESDEGNNDAWLDVYIGLAGPILVDAGATTDRAYSAAAGYGYLNSGTRTVSCGGSAAPDATLRAAITSTLLYRFDHLIPGRFYHLDLTLRDCDGSRAEEVWVDGMRVAPATDLSDHQPHRLSLLLDPALYRDRTITVALVETHGLDALLAEINLHDVDYRYADAGHSSDPNDPADPRYPGPAAMQAKGRAYGWLDGERLASWGDLPGQTVRMDRADDDPTDDPDSELRYRFDGLDPARRYRLRLTFRQLSAASVIQKVQLDGTDATPSFTLNSGQAYSLTVAVPPMAYASDGSIVVGIVRVDCATSEAQVNEISLEEETLPAAAACNVRPTPNRTLATGRVTIRGVPAPAGTVIEAVTPRDEVAGCAVVETAGAYPLMQIYGADPTIPGMQDGELVEFRVNGIPAVAQPSLYWKNDSTPHTVDLSIGSTEGQCSWLAAGWNLFSFRLDPAVPTVERTLGAIAGRYCQVRGERAAYDCTQDPIYRNLKELDPGQSYWLKLEGSAGANLRIEGMTVPVTTPIPLHQYWNWVGYLPAAAQPITTALQSIAGRYLLVLSRDKTYDPAHPERSTLWTLEPGQGYQIRATQAVTLVYPAAASAAYVPDTSESAPGLAARAGWHVDTRASACQAISPTPSLTLLYGQARLGAVPAAAGAVIEIITPRGEVAGCTVVRPGGEYGYVHVYGEDPTDPAVPGFRPGEPLAFRVNGRPAGATPALMWQDDRTPHEVHLAADGWAVWLPMVMK